MEDFKMKDFGVILNECFEKLEITQSNAAQLIGCSRSMIYSVLNGEKNLTESKFQNMIATINFTDEQISRLRYAYYKDKYPLGVIDKIFKLHYFLSGRHERTNSITISPLPIPDSSSAVTGKWELLSIIAALILDDKTKKITTNFSFKDNLTDDVVFSALIEKKDDIDFRHIIVFDSSNTSDTNISNLFLSLRYIRRGFNPLYCYSELTTTVGDIYPYYFVTDTHVFFYNTDLSCGMLITERDIVCSVNDMLSVILSKCQPLSSYPTDVFELKNSITKVSSNKISSALGNSACIIPFVPEMIENIANDELPDRELLIKIAVDHYKKLGMHSGPVLFPQSALERFAADGRVFNFPLSWTKPMTYADRQKVFKILKKYVCGDNPKIRVLHDNSMKIADACFSIDIFERYMSIAGSLDNSENNYCGEYSIFIKNTSIISDFRFFEDFIKRNRLYLPSDIAVSYMDSLILECERNKE